MIIDPNVANKLSAHTTLCPYCAKPLPKCPDEFTIDDQVIIVTANGYPAFAHRDCYRSNELSEEQIANNALLALWAIDYNKMIAAQKRPESWFGTFDLFKAFDYLMDNEPDNTEFTYGMGRIQHEFLNLLLAEGTRTDIRCAQELTRYVKERKVIFQTIKPKIIDQLNKVSKPINLKIDIFQ